MTFKQLFFNATNLIKANWGQNNKSITSLRRFPGETPALKTGLTQLDRATELQGLPQGHITELVSADELAGLSIAAKIATHFQRKQQPLTIIDMAGNFDLAHAIRCGLIAPEVLIHQPDNAFILISHLQRIAPETGLVIVNLGFIAQTFAGADSGVLTALLGRLHGIVKKSPNVFLFLTVLEEVNPLIYTNYPPGFPIYDAAAIRLWIQDEGWIKRKGRITGYRGNIAVIKNKLGRRGKGANLRIPFIDPELNCLTEALGL